MESYIGKAGPCPACGRVLRLVARDFVPGTDNFAFALLIEKGPEGVGEQLFLGGEAPIEIGKLAGREIVLNDVSVSRRHCRLVRAPAGWRIEDQGSKNGIRVNEARVADHELRDGDVVRLGHFTLRYVDTGLDIADTAIRTKEAAPDDDLYALAAMEEAPPAAPVEPMPAATAAGLIHDPAGAFGPDGPECPCCGKRLSTGAKICVECGVDLQTGRAVLTAHDADLDRIYDVTEGVVRVISWVIPLGLYPVASEAFGTRRPYVTWALAVVTVIISAWFLGIQYADSSRLRLAKNLMLWCGNAPPTAERLYVGYQDTSYGDSDAFEKRLEDLTDRLKEEREKASRAAAQDAAPAGRRPNRPPELSKADMEKLILEAHNALSPEQQCTGQYRWSQLITYAFLHGGILHLAGNLLFLLVLGSRVNALIGNIGTTVAYPLLAVIAGLAHAASVADSQPQPMVGASGAIMGLAGMYLVLLPLHNVHMVAWLRWGLIRGFRLSFTIFTVRGFWVVFFYIAFDVAFTALGIRDQTAHWAHLGGFIAGVALGLVLLLTRLVNCRGGDILSAMLGRRAWALIGRPNRPMRSLP